MDQTQIVLELNTKLISIIEDYKNGISDIHPFDIAS